MDEHKVAPEELAAEQAALQEGKVEEIRASIIEEFGFDETADAERIEKLVTREVEQSKKLSSAIAQKIKWRTEATKPKDTTVTPKPEVKTTAPEEVETTVAKVLEKRDLESLDYPDDIKTEIQRIAQITQVSVLRAAKDPYIVTKIDAWKKEQQSDEAAISRTNRSSGKKELSIDSPPDVDMSTPEGRKEWNDYKKAMTKAGN